MQGKSYREKCAGVVGCAALLSALGFTRSPAEEGRLVLAGAALDVDLLAATATKIFMAIPATEGGGGQ